MKDIIRMNQLAGIITEGQAKKMMEILNENKDIDYLFDEWKKGEVAVGNTSANVDTYKDLGIENSNVFRNFLNLVEYYPNVDLDDLAAANSIGMYGGIGTKYELYDWNNLTKKEYYELMRNFYW